jgi:ribosome-associated toxin RatA of RatAB toxin-antitoxin module
MPSVKRTEIFPYSSEKIYQVLTDFESYPKFVEGVDDLVVLEKSEQYVKARYSLNMIKKFQYVLEIRLEAPHQVSWTFLEGSLFKKNDGSWKLTPLEDNKTQVDYSLDVEFKLFAPKTIIKKLVETSLPNMLKSFEKRVGEVSQ